MTRRALACCLFALLAASSGCAAFGGGAVSEARLAESAEYDWNTSANTTITVEKGADVYEAVYRIDGRDRIELYRHQEFGNDRPLPVSAVYFRYPNGTTVNLGTDAVGTANSRTVITLPAANGRLALSAPKRGKLLTTVTPVEGSHEVILPRGADVRIPLMNRVVPDNYERSVENGRVHLTWQSIRGNRIVVRYYLGTDVLIFGGLVAGGIIVAIGGVAYFWLQLRTLRQRREDVAWDGNP